MQLSQSFGIASIAAATSFTTSILIVKSQQWHGRYSLDSDLKGVQKFHKTAVPRIGGIAVVMGIFIALFACMLMEPSFVQKFYVWETFLLTVAGLPAFVAGTIEDLTKKVSVRIRLIATFISAILASYLVGAILHKIDFWGVDQLLIYLPIAVFFTAFVVAGGTNSINIIDGFNGVAGGATIIMLGAFAFLGWKADDRLIVELSLLGMCASFGFLLMNYPTGQIFMGDGGAYFLGFWVSEVAVLLLARNPHVNAWQVLGICAYPIIEVIFSMYRRKIIRNSSPGEPDRLHLHTLIYRRISCQLLKRNDAKPWIRNAAVSSMVSKWILTMSILSIIFGNTVPGAMLVVLIQVWLYVVVYARLVRHRWCVLPTINIKRLLKTRRLQKAESKV